MSASSVLCPSCHAALKLDGPARPGKRAKCPKCGSAVPLPAAPTDAPEHTAAPSTITGDSSRPDPAPTAPHAGPADPANLRFDFLAPPQTPDEIGRLGPYRVLGVLGQGGMGLVFRAEDTKLGRLVALKLMLPQVAANPTANRRFVREARAQAKVEHDHVAPIYHVFDDHRPPFVVMPLLKGQSLAAALKANPRPPVPEVLRIGREIADGLAAAHDQGLIHRDIKPGNVWLDGPGRRVKILDFGLARVAQAAGGGADEPITASGAVMGTPSYMAPEQAGGRPVDHRADLFSLGVVLYQMATGELPFKGGDVFAILTALAIEAPPPPLAVDPELPPALSDLIVRLLAKGPADRPPSAAAVADELRRVEASLSQTVPVLPADAGPPADDPWASIAATEGEVEPAPRPVRRRGRGGPPAWAAVLLGLLAIGGGLWLLQVVIDTPKGKLVIDATADPDAEIVVTNKKTGAVLRTKDREVALEVGDYGIDVTDKKGGLRLTASEFTLANDGKPIHVKLLPPPRPPAAGPPDPTPGFAPDEGTKKAVAWVWSVGGTVTADGHRKVEPKAPLPGPVERVALGSLPDPVIDADVANLRGLPALADLDLSRSQVTAAGVKALAGMPFAKSLDTLRLGHTPLTDAALGHLSGFPRLSWLELNGVTGLTPAGFAKLRAVPRLSVLIVPGCDLTDAHLAELKGVKLTSAYLVSNPRLTAGGIATLAAGGEMTSLNLGGCRATDAWLPAIALGMPKLKVLYVNESGVTDAGLPPLAGLTGLTDLSLAKTKVTEAGVRKLAAALPKCKIQWDGGPTPPPVLTADQARQEQADAAQQLGRPVQVENSVGMKLNLIPAGRFLMGSPAGEPGRRENEGPQHAVAISRPLYLGVHEVTQEQYRAVTGADPASTKGPTRPVESVSWADAVEFCRKLSARDAERAAGRVYRLPTEAEWEYACRAGTRTAYSFGDQSIDLPRHAWYGDIDDGLTHPVGTKAANAWGLHDMHGNVWEMCADFYQSDYYQTSPWLDPTGPAAGSAYAIRGGARTNPAREARAANRWPDWTGQPHGNIGFRVACDARPPDAPTFFSGKDLTGWVTSAGTWKVVNGELVGVGGGAAERTVVTARTYTDFEIAFRIKRTGGGNPSFVFRGPTPTQPGGSRTSPRLMFSARGVVNVTPLAGGQTAKKEEKGKNTALMLKPDEFTDVTVRCVGSRLTVTANGKPVTDGEFDMPAEGVIGWAAGAAGAEVTVRDIRFTDLSRPAAAASPFDRPRREDVPAEKLKAAGGGDPAKVPPEVVAILGDSRPQPGHDHIYTAVHPSGTAVALAFGEGANRRLVLWEPATRAERPFPGPRGVHGLRFSPDGKWLAVAGDGAALWPTAGGPQGRVLSEQKYRVFPSFAFTPDGRWVAYANKANRGDTDPPALYRVDDPAAPPVPLAGAADTQASAMAISPDGSLAAVANEGKTAAENWVKLWSVPDGRFVRIVSEGHLPARGLAFSGDGRRLFQTRFRGGPAVYANEVATGRELPAFTLPVPAVVGNSKVWANDVAVSPDGRRAAAGTMSGAVVVWNPEAADPAGTARVIALDPPTSGNPGGSYGGGIYNVVWAPDGRHLLTRNADGTMYVVRLETATALAPADPDRALAEWALARRGRVHLLGPPGLVAAPADLPAGPFRVANVSFWDEGCDYRLTDADLDRLRPCEKLTQIQCKGCDLTDAGLAKLASFPQAAAMTRLILQGAKFTPAGVARLSAFRSLTALSLYGATPGPEGLVAITGLPELTSLDLLNGGLTDADLAGFARLKKLHALNLVRNPGVTDAGLPALAGLPGLTHLVLTQTRVTKAGAEKLAAALPLCRIEGDGWAVEPRDPGRALAAWALARGGQVGLAGQLGWLTTPDQLPAGPVQLVNVSLETATGRFTDADLEVLRGVGKLHILRLGKTDLTDAGLDALTKMPFAAGLTSLHLAAPRVTDAGVAHIARCRELNVLHLLTTRVTDAGLAALLPQLPKLVQLTLITSEITGTGLAAARGLPLNYLRVNGCKQFADDGLKSGRDLRAVQHLDLTGTAVTDAGLAHLAGWDKLELLNLAGTPTADAGLTHLAGLKGLRRLYLRSTKVTDAGLAAVGKLAGLTVLDLDSTAVTDAGLPKLAGLTGLQELRLSGTKATKAGAEKVATALPLCRIVYDGGRIEPRAADRPLAEWALAHGGRVQLVGRPDWVTKPDQLPAGPVQLAGVDLENGTARPTDADIERLRSAAGLTALNLWQTDLTDAGLDALTQMPFAAKLISLYVIAPKATDTGVAHLARCPELIGLNLRGTQVTDAGLAALLPRLPKLVTLTLDYSPIAGTGLAAARGLPLTALRVMACKNFAADGLKAIRDCRAITHLDLSGTGVSDAALAHLAGRDKLEALVLANTPVTDAGLVHLAGLPGLRRLQVESTRVTDAGLDTLGRMAGLSILDLRSNAVTDAGLARLTGMTGLRLLRLSGTKATKPGAEKLAAALPLCRIEYDGGAIEPRAGDRPLAAWVFARGGHIGLAGLSGWLTRPDQLPAGPVRVGNVNLDTATARLTDADLDLFRPADKLAVLTLGKTDLTDAGLDALTKMPFAATLAGLNFAAPRVTDAGVAHLARCKGLISIQLDETRVTDAELADLLPRLPLLRTLILNGSAITGNGLGAVPKLPVTYLRLNGCRNVSDDALKGLAGNRIILQLMLRDTGVTDAGLAHLAGWQQLELLDLFKLPVTDAGLTRLAGLQGLRRLIVRGTKVTDAGAETLGRMTALAELDLAFTALTDAGLAKLTGMAGLRELNLASTKVTKAGVEKLAAALPACLIRYDGGVIEPRDHDRLVAEWVLARRGQVQLAGRPGTVAAPADLPAGPFRVTGVHFWGPTGDYRLTDADLDRLRPCEGLTSIQCRACDLTDAGLAKLASFPQAAKFTRLFLNGAKFTSAGIAHLSRFPALTDLSLSYATPGPQGMETIAGLTGLTMLTLQAAGLTDDDLATLARLTKLRALNIILNPRVTDAGLRTVAALPALAGLWLDGTAVTDAGLAPFAGKPTLTNLVLVKTKVTAAGAQKLSAALPNCRVESDAGVIEPWAADRRAVESLRPTGVTLYLRLATGEHRSVAPGNPVPEGPYQLMRVDLYSARDLPPDFVSRVLVPAVADLPALADIFLRPAPHPPLTAADLARLAGTPAGRAIQQLSAYGTPLTPELLAVLKRFPKLSTLILSGKATTDDLLARLPELPTVQRLELSDLPMVSDRGQAALTGLPALRHLGLTGYRGFDRDFARRLAGVRSLAVLDLSSASVGDDELAEIAKTPALATLYLNQTPVTDAGLDHLADRLSLTQLDVRKTRVTGFGVRRLAAALPKCRITWDGGEVAPRDVEREVAEAIIRAGGTVDVTVGKVRHANIAAIDRLPKEAFQVRLILNQAPAGGVSRAIDDRMLDQFRHLLGLSSLLLPKAPVTDAGLARFLASPAAPSLEGLDLNATGISDAGLTGLPALRNLVRLELAGCPKITDATLERAKGLPLTIVGLGKTGITNAGLAHLKGKKMTGLDLDSDAGVTDAGLAHLAGITTLTYLRLNKTGVGDAGLKAVAGCANLADLRLSGTRVTDAGLDTVAGFRKLGTLYLSELPISDAGLARLKGLAGLKTLLLNKTSVTDSGLDHLRGLTALTSLDLRGAKVTKAGVEKLSAALPRCRIETDGGVIGPGKKP